MMKKFCIFAVLPLVFAAAVPAAAVLRANAAEDGYPDLIRERLAFKNLADYAVNDEDGSVLFADGQQLILWTTDEKTVTFEAGAPVVDADCRGGNFYYATANGSYALPSSPEGLPGAKTDHDFSKSVKRDFPQREGYRYYFDGDHEDYYDGNNVFHVVETANNLNHSFTDYKKIKPYGQTIYAVKDNCLYDITDGTPHVQKLYYSNQSLLKEVSAYDAGEQLKTFSEAPRKVSVKKDCKATELNPEIIDGEFFSVAMNALGEPNTVTTLSGQALLLAEAGETRVIAKDDKIYMLSKSNALDGNEISMSGAGNQTAVANASDSAYSVPLISSPSAAVFGIKPGDKLKVISYVPENLNVCLAHDFYLVENENGEHGYVAAEFLNDFSYNDFNEGEASQTPDPAPEKGNNVRTVVLVLLVILLVLIAAGYLTWLFTSGKKGRRERGETGDGPRVNGDENQNGE